MSPDPACADDHSMAGSGRRRQQGNRRRRLAPIVKRAFQPAKVWREHRDSRERLAQLASIVESSQDAILSKTLDGIVTSWNRGAECMYGWSADEVIGRPLTFMLPDGHEDEEAEILARLGRGETIPPYETRRIAKDGSVRDISLTLSPIYAGGEVVGGSSVARDITDRKRAEEALRASEARSRILLEHLPDALVLFFDRDERFLYAAGRLLETTGWTPEELVGRRVGELLPPDSGALLARVFGRALAGEPQSIEIQGVRNPDLILSYSVVPVRDERGEVVGGMSVGRDMSRQRRFEDELRAARELFEGAFENAPVGMAMVGTNGESRGRLIRVNRAFGEMLGRIPQDLIGATTQEITYPDDLHATGPGLDRLLRGEIEQLERQKRYIRANGEPAWGFLHATLVRDGDGAPAYALGVIADVTPRVEAEREQRRLETMLNQAQKLESVGRLAGGIAHDFNNLLAVILNYAELARPEAEGELAEALSEISWAAERAADLTSRLLVFSRQEVVKPVVIGVNDLVCEMRNFLLRTIGEDIDLSTQLDSGAPRVRCDRVQLEQAVINLAVNARDAMPEGGRLRIETHDVEVGPAHALALQGLAPGRYGEIRVVDSGLGMTADVLERAFEPFFTTKEKGQGTGLGLAMIHGIAHGAGGTVLIDSEPGSGTTVRMLLPRADADAAEPSEPEPAEPPLAAERRILVVEDEDAVRRLVEKILERHGYEVLTASRPEEALELAATGTPIDVLLTDVVMPGMPGTRLAEELLARLPDLRVLFMTGYTDRPGELPEEASLLFKPFDAERLLRQVAAA
jgi:PAS domain S-box-containing protein